MRSISEILAEIDRVRGAWGLTEDPGPGSHELGAAHVLKVTEHELKKGEISLRYVIEGIDKPGWPLKMSYSWDSLYDSMLGERAAPQPTEEQEEEFDMGKLSITDEALRNKVRLKCKNDWDHDLTEDQVSMCIIEMEEQRLSLFHNQLWPNKRSWKKKEANGRGGFTWTEMERIAWDKTIDGYRTVAHRSGRFAGMGPAEFVMDGDTLVAAKMTVYALDKNGTKHAYVGEARWDEFAQMKDEYVDRQKTGRKVPSAQWAEKPRNMLSVAAERQALRKAFQETDDDVVGAEDLQQGQEPELEVEGSRGSAVLTEPAPAGEPVQENREAFSAAGSITVDEPVQRPALPPEEVRIPYVGIPKGGFLQFGMYNKEERIVMLKKVASGDIFMALDSGRTVAVNVDGYESFRKDRTEGPAGGKEWASGDLYYTGEKVEKVAPSKKDEMHLWLALDNGFKVLVDQWGKELKKKERKKKEKTEAPAPVPEPVRTEAPPPAQPPKEAPTAGPAPEDDIESITSVEMLRKRTEPLLKTWCNTIMKQRMSFKGAYKELTGVVVKKGVPMELNDYKALYETLAEAIEGAKASA